MTGLYPQDAITAAVVDSLLDEEADLFAGLGVSAYKGIIISLFAIGLLGVMSTDELLHLCFEIY